MVVWLQAGGGVCGSAENDERFGEGSSLQIGGMRCWTVCKGVVGSMRERRAAFAGIGSMVVARRQAEVDTYSSPS